MRTCFSKDKNLIFSVSLGVMIEGYSNLCEGDTSNVGSSGSCSCFLLYFKVDPSTGLQ